MKKITVKKSIWNTILKYSTEFRVPFSENPVVYGMAFAEAGGVWNDTRLLTPMGFPRRNPLELKRSAGIGIRFFMPMIGMLGFDMGYGFDDITGDGNPQGWEYTIIFGRWQLNQGVKSDSTHNQNG